MLMSTVNNVLPKIEKKKRYTTNEFTCTYMIIRIYAIMSIPSYYLWLKIKIIANKIKKKM